MLADHVARALAEERAEASPGGWPGLQAVLTQQLYGLLLGPDFAPPAPGEAALGALRRSDQRRAFLYDALGFVLSRAAAFRPGGRRWHAALSGLVLSVGCAWGKESCLVCMCINGHCDT